MAKDNPETIADLKPAPFNPRRISDAALKGLGKSVEEFGDLSGLVWSKRNQYLICGHQRLAALKILYGDALKLQDGAVITPAGERFAIRVVDWDNAHEKAANVAANNPHIAGEFTSDLSGILDDLQIELPDLSEALRFEELKLPEWTLPDDNKQIDEDELAKTSNKCPKCGFEW
jgi:hypothetical protein